MEGVNVEGGGGRGIGGIKDDTRGELRWPMLTVRRWR
jgi:hypothetical protein